MNERPAALDYEEGVAGWPWGVASIDRNAPATFTMRDSVQSVFVRTAATLRALWAVLVLATVAGPSFIAPMPRAAVPVVVATIGWAAFVWGLAKSNDIPARLMAWLDAAIFATILVGETSLVPDPLIGDGTSWVFLGATVSVLVASLLLGPAETIAITVVLIAAYLAGIGAGGESVLTPDGPGTSLVLLVQGIISTAAVSSLRRTANSADEALHREVADRRAVIVETQKELERDAQERLLHDKVRSTLWLIGDGHLLGRRATALRSCDESFAALRGLREGRIADGLTRSVAHAVQDAVDWAGSIGLDVDLTVRSEHHMAAANTDVENAAIVCEAIGAATRQALANVRAHARTDTACVDLVIGPGAVRVTVRDDGRGFDPTRIGADRQGVRTSIVGRMQEVGGRAEVQSKPALGTTVTLTWRDEPAGPADAVKGGGSALRLYGRNSVRILVMAGLVFHGLSLYAALHFASDYTYPWAALTAWAAQLAVGAILVMGIGRTRPQPFLVWLGVAAVLAAATVVVVDCQPRGVLGFANWAFGDAVWPLSFAAAYLPVRRVALALAAHDAIQTAVIAVKVGDDLAGLLKLSAILLENVMLQIGLAVAFAILVRTTNVTARAVWRSGMHRARLYAGQLARRSRAIRAAEVDTEIYSLLDAVSSGVLDPDSSDTRSRFRAASRTMRREDALASVKADVTNLSEIAEQAAAAGVHVEIGLAESFDYFPARVREPMITVMARAMKFALPGQAMIVLHNHADMTLQDWEGTGAEHHRDVHSMTLSFSVHIADAILLREEIRRIHVAEGAVLTFDLDIEPDDAPAAETAQAWLAMAGR